MTVNQLSNLSPDGTTMGQSTSDMIAFYGGTPRAQRSGTAQGTITDSSGGTANTATGVAALTATYNSTIIANALATIIAQTNEMRAVLVSVNLMKGSA